MRLLYYVILFLLIGFVAGCQNGKFNFSVQKKDSLESILNYYESINKMTNVEVKNEYKNTEKFYVENGGEDKALKYVFILIFPDSEYYNSHKAVDILDELLRKNENRSDPHRIMALLIKNIIISGNKKDILYEETNKRLDSIISERKKQDTLYEKISEKLDFVIRENEIKDSVNKKLHDELVIKRQTVENLQRKIEKLKAIEKSINERKDPKDPTT